jgi:signal peptidase I
MRRLWKILIGVSAAVGVACSLLVGGAAVEARTSTHDHIVITGNSMYPAITIGDVITIDPLRRPRVGDVVTFARDGKKVTHRIIDMWGSFDPSGAPRLLYKTQGDNNRTSDPWVVTDRDILGVQVPTPLVTRLAHPISSQPLLLALLVAPLMLSMLASEVRNIGQTVHSIRHHADTAHLGAESK